MAMTGKWSDVWMERFQDALLEAFPLRADLEWLNAYGLSENLGAIMSDTELRNALSLLLKRAKSRGKLDLILEQARSKNPDNPALCGFADQMSPFLVPFAADGGFVGRTDDLEHLHGLLKNGALGVRRVALVGMGGVGKTQLAVEYAHRYRREYPGGIYWVNAAAPVVAEITSLAARLGLGEDTAFDAERLGPRTSLEADGPGHRLRMFEQHLRYERPGALMIFDNVADPLALREPTAGIVPWELPCHLLFTTRRQESDASFDTVHIGVLPEQAALSLLASKARRAILDRSREEEREAAKEICRALGHLPLAVALAAAYLGKSPGLTLSDYLSRIRGEGALATADATKLDPLWLATHHASVVGATLRAQWDALKTFAAKYALQAAALFRNAAHVSRVTLAQLTGLSDKAKPGYQAPLEEALQELRGWSLVEVLTEKDIRLHPLVREFASARIEQREVFAAECAERLGEALEEVARIEDEVRARGLDAVLADLRLGEELGGVERRDRFRRLLRPLDREAHCLRRWDPDREPGFFLQQIRNISFELGVEDLQVQAEAALRARPSRWLRERLRASRESEALVRTLAGHTNSVWGVAVMPDGRSALSASDDGMLKVWDLASGCELRTLSGHASRVNGVAVTPNGRLAVSASDDQTLKVWDLASGREVHTLKGHTEAVNGVAVTPDGCFAVSASDDRTLKVWDVARGDLVRTLPGHTEAVNGVVVTPDGRFAVSASEDNTLKVWRLSSGEEVRTLAGHAGAVIEVAVTLDGGLVVSASLDRTLKVWKLSTGAEVRTLVGHKASVTGVATTPDGRRVVSASEDKTLKVWDLSSGDEIYTLAGHTETVKDVAVTPDGRHCVSASHDWTLKLWELWSEREVSEPDGHKSSVAGVSVTSDGRFCVSASHDWTLKVWDLATCAHVRTLEGHTSLVLRVAVTRDGRHAISASEDRTVKVWDLWSDRRPRTLSGHAWGVNAVAVTPDGRLCVSALGDKTLKVWKLSSGDEVHTLVGHADAVMDVAVTPDGRWAISASSDRTLKVWELSSGRERFTLIGHTSGVTSVAVLPDGSLAISASEDTTLKVWNLETGKEICTLAAHTATVNGVAVAPGGRMAISVSDDATLRVWDLVDNRSIATLEARAPFLSCAVAPDGRTFIAGDGAGSLHILEWIDPSAEGLGMPATLVAAPGAKGTRTESRTVTAGSVRRVAAGTSSSRSAPGGSAFLTTAIPGSGAPLTPAAAVSGRFVQDKRAIAQGSPALSPQLIADRIKVLYLASNPMVTRQMQLSREARQLQARLGVGPRREVIDLVPEWAVRRSDLQRLLLEQTPHVLHFSSHGSARAQLLLEDDAGNAAPVDKRALVELIGILNQGLQLVVLNACDTDPLARALVQHVPCAIGMRQPIGDEAAIVFAASFYRGLAFGKPIETAFKLACNELKLQQIPEESTPALRVKKGVDATTMVLTVLQDRGPRGK